MLSFFSPNSAHRYSVALLKLWNCKTQSLIFYPGLQRSTSGHVLYIKIKKKPLWHHKGPMPESFEDTITASWRSKARTSFICEDYDKDYCWITMEWIIPSIRTLNIYYIITALSPAPLHWQVWQAVSRSVRSARLPTCNANIQRERAEIWVFCDVLHSEQVGRSLKDELQLSGTVRLCHHRRGDIFSM